MLLLQKNSHCTPLPQICIPKRSFLKSCGISAHWTHSNAFMWKLYQCCSAWCSIPGPSLLSERIVASLNHQPPERDLYPATGKSDRSWCSQLWRQRHWWTWFFSFFFFYISSHLVSKLELICILIPFFHTLSSFPLGSITITNVWPISNVDLPRGRLFCDSEQ